LDILLVKNEAKLSASEVNDVEVGRGDADLRQSNLFTVCQPEAAGVVRNSKDKIRVVLLCRRENKVVVAVAERFKR